MTRLSRVVVVSVDATVLMLVISSVSRLKRFVEGGFDTQEKIYSTKQQWRLVGEKKNEIIGGGGVTYVDKMMKTCLVHFFFHIAGQERNRP